MLSGYVNAKLITKGAYADLPPQPTELTMTALRTLMFAPGNHPRKVEKCFTLGADAIILDLEDAVAVDEKIATRQTVIDALANDRSCQGYIRVNACDTDFCYGDLKAVITKHVDGIILPKVESAHQLLMIEWLMANLEREAGLDVGSIDLIPIIETGLGMMALEEIATAKTRVKRLSFGAGDYTLDMNSSWSRDESEIAHARGRMLLASRAAGLEPPLDTVWIEIKDDEGFEASCDLGRRMGFQGKLCIYPTQVPVANAAFTPTTAEVDKATRIVAAFEKAEAEGSASIQVDGYFVDYPIVEKARRTLALIQRIKG